MSVQFAEPAIEVDDELLFRQVRPTWLREGRVGAEAFIPRPKDEKLLSVAREALIDGEGAYRHHVEKLGYSSAGTWAVTVGECRTLELKAFPDALTSPPETVAYPAHTSIDFRPFDDNEIEAKAMILTAGANERGRLYPPIPDAMRTA
jgi:hypothetical protein